MKEDKNKHTGLVPKAKVLAQSSYKAVKLLWTNAGQYETMMSQMLRDTVDPDEQAIILQQLQAVIKKKTILTPLMLLMILRTCVTITQNKWPMICPYICVVPVA